MLRIASVTWVLMCSNAGVSQAAHNQNFKIAREAEEIIIAEELVGHLSFHTNSSYLAWVEAFDALERSWRPGQRCPGTDEVF